MFSMFVRTGVPTKRGPHMRTSMNCCNMAACWKIILVIK